MARPRTRSKRSGTHTLADLLRERTLIRVQRTPEALDDLVCIPLGVSEELLLVRDVVDFHLDGFRVLPRASVEGLRHGPLERFRHAVLRAEGALDDLESPQEVALESWQSAARVLKARPLVAVERELDREQPFLVGRIRRAHRKSLSLLPYDPFARPAGEEVRIPYEEMTALSFGGEYVETLARYLRD